MVLLHALKHPSQPLFGLLLGTATASDIKVTMAVPVAHLPLLAPTVEAALLQAAPWAASRGLAVVGAYTATATAGDPAAVVPARAVTGLATLSGTPAALFTLDNDALLDLFSLHGGRLGEGGSDGDDAESGEPEDEAPRAGGKKAVPPLFKVIVATGAKDSSLTGVPSVAFPEPAAAFLNCLRASVASNVLPGDFDDFLDGTAPQGAQWLDNSAVQNALDAALAK